MCGRRAADLVTAGIPARAALASATSIAAQACGLADRKGRLRSGYDADMIVVDGDPLTNISALTRVKAVYLAGHRLWRSVRITRSMVDNE